MNKPHERNPIPHKLYEDLNKPLTYKEQAERLYSNTVWANSNHKREEKGTIAIMELLLEIRDLLKKESL